MFASTSQDDPHRGVIHRPPFPAQQHVIAAISKMDTPLPKVSCAVSLMRHYCRHNDLG